MFSSASISTSQLENLGSTGKLKSIFEVIFQCEQNVFDFFPFFYLSGEMNKLQQHVEKQRSLKAEDSASKFIRTSNSDPFFVVLKKYSSFSLG